MTGRRADSVYTVMTTYSSSGSRRSERGYYAFGADRREVSALLTDHLFTGQKLDDTGLYYYNARYYDPEIGHFISPDTIVPDPMRVDAYNRYMYALGNPLRFSDPSGHCISLSNLGEDPIRDMENDSACWTQVDGILYSAWDQDPTYWEKRYTSKDIFEHWVAATSSNNTEFFQHERQAFHAYQDAEQHRLDFLSAKYGNDIYVPWNEPQPCQDLWDCQALRYDLYSVTASVAGDVPILPITAAAKALDITSTGAGLNHTTEQYNQGNASKADLIFNRATALASIVPIAGEVSGIAQLIWDIVDPFHPW